MNTTRSSLTVNNSLNYVYDNIYQLTQSTRPLPAQPDETFNYDPLGNRLLSDGQTTNSIIGQGNRLLDDTAFTYTYDNNGNLIQKTDNATNETTDYTYSAENKLIRIDLPGGSVAQYSSDGLGRRIEKDVDGVITRYVYDGKDILLEFDGTNTQIARYTHGPGIDESLIMARGGQSLFYQTDGLGSIIDLTDINGAVAKSYVYNSFGNIEQQIGNVVNPYTYTGREIDTESGLYYYRARYYDSIMGRFINEDPIGFAAGDNNFYRYVQNNPVNFVDPEGLLTLQFGVSVNAGAGGGATSGFGFVIGFSWKNGFQFGTYDVVGAGGYAGVGGSAVIDFTFSGNKCIKQLEGTTGTVGGSGTVPFLSLNVGGETNIPIDGNNAAYSYTGSVGIGGGTPIEGHGFVTNTKITELTKTGCDCN